VKVLCVLGKYAYGHASRGLGYEYVNFLPALRKLGAEVEVFDTLDRTAYSGFGELNRELLTKAFQYRPDIILFVLMHYEIWTETLSLLSQELDAALVHWATDDSWKYRQFSRYLASYFDIHASTCRRALAASRQDGLNNVVHTQWAASGSALQEPFAAERCRYAVTFVGSKYGNRAAWVKSLHARGVKVACFGHGWPGGAVAAEHIPDIFRDSVISLNFGDSGIVWEGGFPAKSRQIKARVFEVPGSGGFLLTEPAEDLDRYFAIGREIETFASPDELANKIKHYLGHPRDRDEIAAAGHLRVRREHTYEQRFRDLVNRAETIRQQRSARSRASVPSASVWPEFENMAKSHQLTPALRLLRSLLLLPCIAVWGRQRGPRAARRILFEIYWRLAGARTYSARGWPGRMFFLES
jgi:spore maturation protein CgeB